MSGLYIQPRIKCLKTQKRKILACWGLWGKSRALFPFSAHSTFKDSFPRNLRITGERKQSKKSKRKANKIHLAKQFQDIQKGFLSVGLHKKTPISFPALLTTPALPQNIGDFTHCLESKLYSFLVQIWTLDRNGDVSWGRLQLVVSYRGKQG